VSIAAPHHLYKIVSKENWEESLLRGELVLPAFDQPFIHLAKEDQVVHVAEKFWAGMEYVVVKIESEGMVGRLVYEANPGGSTKYYHLYEGTIPLDAVVEVK